MLCPSRCNAVISLPVCSCLQIANGASELGWSKMTLSDSNLTLSGLGLVGPLWNPVWVHGGAGSCSLPYRYSQGLLQSSARSWCSVDYCGTNESVPLRLTTRFRTCSGGHFYHFYRGGVLSGREEALQVLRCLQKTSKVPHSAWMSHNVFRSARTFPLPLRPPKILP